MRSLFVLLMLLFASLSSACQVAELQPPAIAEPELSPFEIVAVGSLSREYLGMMILREPKSGFCMAVLRYDRSTGSSISTQPLPKEACQ